MPIVEFKNVSRVYKSGDHELKALDGVNFSLNEGKFVVILGVLPVPEKAHFLTCSEDLTVLQAGRFM